MSAPQVISVLEVAQEVTEANAIADLTDQCAQVEPEVLVMSSQMSSDTQAGFPGPPPLHGPMGQNDSDITVQNNESRDSDPLREGQGLASNANACNGPPDKKCRRVFFPSGEQIVSGFTHPPSPWNDVSTCSTDDLIGAYRRACETHGVKAIPKLLQQLMAITNFCDRNETLTLRGERLDARHCETMEEVLRRVQFRTIDLESCHLEEDGATALFDMIEYYESCTKLNISYNKTIGVRGWQSCARMMKKTPCLEYLEARGCTISDQVMPFIGRSIRLGSKLTTLHLENAIMSGRPLMIMVAAIKMNDILRELFLADNKLMPSDGIQLGNLLKFNHRLQLLDLRNNHLQDVGVSHIADGLWEQNLGMGLNTLVLWNNSVTYQSMVSLSRALINTKSLETLNLGHNNITNEGIYRLKEGLLNNKSLLRIGLQAAKISDEGAVALAEYIAESPRLLRMDVRENDIKTGGLMALSLSLKVSESVTRIDLDKEPKKDSAMKDYIEQQRRLQNDIQNYTTRNKELAWKREEEEERKKVELEKAQLEAQIKKEEEERLAEELAKAAEADGSTDQPVETDIEVVTQEEAADLQVSPPVPENIPEVDLQADESEEADKTACRPSPKTLKLNFNLPLAKTQTLESPAFVSAAELPVLTPPPDKYMKDLENVAAIAASLQTPRDFPPSPMMCSDGRSILAAIPENPPAIASEIVTTAEQTTVQSPPKLSLGASATVCPPVQTSPNTRRKFIISRVEECPDAKEEEKPFHLSEAAENQPTIKSEQGHDSKTDNDNRNTPSCDPGPKQETKSTTDTSRGSHVHLSDSKSDTELTSSGILPGDVTLSGETPSGGDVVNIVIQNVDDIVTDLPSNCEAITQSDSQQESSQSGLCKAPSNGQSGQSEPPDSDTAESNESLSGAAVNSSSNSNGSGMDVTTGDLCVDPQTGGASHVVSAEQVKLDMEGTGNTNTGSCDKASGNVYDCVSDQRAVNSASIANQETDKNSNIDHCAMANMGSAEFHEIQISGDQCKASGATGNQTISANVKGVDFHSNLTMNGMKTELATAVMDTLEKEINDLDLHQEHEKIANESETDATCSPDEFERELDEMLASVGSGLSITTTSEKSMEDILAEAVGEL